MRRNDPNFDTRRFGFALSAKRCDLDMSVPQFERYMEEVTGWAITPKTVYSYECGQRVPNFITAINLARTLYGDDWEKGLVALAKAGMRNV